MTIIDLLSTNHLTRHLDRGDIERLASLAAPRRYAAGGRLTHYGEIWPYLFLLETGSVTALKETADGRALAVVAIHPGEIFWGLSFFQEGTPMVVSLVADEDSKVHFWSREDLVPVLKQDGRMAWALSQLMLSRMLRASDILEEMAFQPIGGRLANLLLEHYGGQAVADFVMRDMTLEEMAQRTGSTRETICRQLYRLMDLGAIQITRTEFKIADNAVLSNLAGRQGQLER
jgi:CRP-like cAMP-binding protein